MSAERNQQVRRQVWNEIIWHLMRELDGYENITRKLWVEISEPDEKRAARAELQRIIAALTKARP